MRIGNIFLNWLDMKSSSLPLEYPIMQALKIYAKRSAVFLCVICANFLLLGIVVGISNPVLWFLISVLILSVLQRILHRENQAVILILTRDSRLTMGIFSILFLPGVLLHELSYFLVAKILHVRTGRFSIFPQSLPDGRLQCGYVETGRTDIVRDALIGSAPLIAGVLFVAYVATYHMNLLPLWDSLRNAQWDGFWTALKAVLTLPGFWVWFYLTFTVSSTMMPSESDRHAWLELLISIAVLVVVALLIGAGSWLLGKTVSPLNNFLVSVVVTFGLSAFMHILLILPTALIRKLLAYATGVDVA